MRPCYNVYMLEKYLEEIGLSDKEAAIYLALLGFESATPSELAEKTGIKRTTVYVVLEQLSKKGLASEVDTGKVIHYQASPPDRLETFVEQQKLKLEETSARLKDIIPQLKSVEHESGERPVVKFFDGKEAVLNNEIGFFTPTDKGGEGYFIFNRDLIEEVFSPHEIANVQKIRPAKDIVARSIYNYTKSDLPSNELSERRRADDKEYPISCDISIYEDRVQIVTLGKHVSSIFIKSKDVADTLKSVFRLAFERLGR